MQWQHLCNFEKPSASYWKLLEVSPRSVSVHVKWLWIVTEKATSAVNGGRMHFTVIHGRTTNFCSGGVYARFSPVGGKLVSSLQPYAECLPICNRCMRVGIQRQWDKEWFQEVQRDMYIKPEVFLSSKHQNLIFFCPLMLILFPN